MWNADLGIIIPHSSFADQHSDGGVAQLGERLPCTQEVIGSNPFTSTIVFFLILVLVSVSGIEY